MKTKTDRQIRLLELEMKVPESDKQAIQKKINGLRGKTHKGNPVFIHKGKPQTVPEHLVDSVMLINTDANPVIK